MELSKSLVFDGLLAFSEAKFSDQAYKTVVQSAFRVAVSGDSKADSEVPAALAKLGVDAALAKQAYSSALSLAYEAAKHDTTAEELSPLLEEAKMNADRVKYFTQLFMQSKDQIRRQLSLRTFQMNTVTNVKWRLDYYIKSNAVDKARQPVYFITLETKNPGDNTKGEINFTCSLEELQDLVGKLKDATKQVERLVSPE